MEAAPNREARGVLRMTLVCNFFFFTVISSYEKSINYKLQSAQLFNLISLAGWR